LEALGIKQNRGSFRKVCPGTELLGWWTWSGKLTLCERLKTRV
jgi:hypothetical protein